MTTRTSNHAIQAAENTLVKAEPVIAAHAASAILGYAGTLLVTHGVITNAQASTLTQQVLPAVVAGLLVLLGVIVRRVVSPAALFAQRVEEEVQKRLDALALPSATVPTVVPASVPPASPRSAGEPADAGADVLAQADAIHPMPSSPPISS